MGLKRPTKFAIVLALLGAGLAVFGVALIYPPAALILGGAGLFWVGYLATEIEEPRR